MLPSIPKRQGSSEERKLCKIYRTLDSSDQQTLLSFAEFLDARLSSRSDEPNEPLLQELVEIPRPMEESVIKGIRRLSKTYPMLDKDSMFDQISSLMTAHIMEGRAASDVIDELEEIFANRYADLNNG